MAKKPTDATVKVVMSCVYSGETVVNPGDVLETDAEEAERLIGMGAAKPYTAPAEAATE